MSPYGGDKEARTLDPLLAKQVLSQLSYTPTVSRFGVNFLYLLVEVPVFTGLSKLNTIEALSFPCTRINKSSLFILPDSLERR